MALAHYCRSFDEDMVNSFSSRLDSLDFSRLDRGLAAAQHIIEQTEEKYRTQNYIAQNDAVALMALFESLCCVEFHKSEELLSRHFNYVFEQVQGRRLLRISDLLPAMARFLFDSNPKRLLFAQSAWQKTETMLTAKTFDWVVHDALSDALVRADTFLVDVHTVVNFWKGFLLLLDKMDNDLVTHSLRAMEVQPSIYLVGCSSLFFVTFQNIHHFSLFHWS